MSEGLGKGSEFEVRLPLCQESLQANAIAQKQPLAASKGRRVLVVDDNRDSRDSLGKLLSLLGHEVAVACDGEQAIETASRFLPNVILL